MQYGVAGSGGEDDRQGNHSGVETPEGNTMSARTGRIRRLENRFGIVDTRPQLLFVMCNAGWGLALEIDECLAILRECGFLPTGTGGAVVDFGHLPEDLNAEELEKFLRENGADLCGLGRVKRDGVESVSPTP
jgi:hypothetical protein